MEEWLKYVNDIKQDLKLEVEIMILKAEVAR